MSRFGRPPRRSLPDTAFGAAGWLFAELALVLAVVAFASEPPGVVTTETSGPTAAPSVTEPPAPPPPPPDVGLSLTTHRFVIGVPVNGVGVADEFRRLLDTQVGAGAKVGLILIFGVSRTGNPLQGVAVAQRLTELIRPAGIPQLATTVDIRAYLGNSGDGRPGDALVELFLLNGP